MSKYTIVPTALMKAIENALDNSLAYFNMEAQRHLLGLPEEEDEIRQKICIAITAIRNDGSIYVGNLQRIDETRQAVKEMLERTSSLH